MPVCVDCERWSPGTFKRCPDCSGVLKLEPLWARPSKDPQLTRLDEEAKWWHRRARDGGTADSTEAEAWATVEDRRRRYEELRRRLLPELEAAEARRISRMEAGARAAGLPVPAYERKVARDEREREQAAVRASNELARASDAGLITNEEYHRRQAEVWSAFREARAHADEAAAIAEGLSISAYHDRAKQELRRRERLWGGEQAWLSDPGGWAQVWFISFLALPISGVVGIIVVIAYWLTGRSPLGAVAGVVVGGLAGWILAQVVFFGTWAVLDWLAPRSWAVRRVGEPVLSAAFAVIFIVPPVCVILAALRLS